MIAIRRCRKCGQQFDALVGIDPNIYCENCRDIMEMLEGDTEAQQQAAQQQRRMEDAERQAIDEAVDFPDLDDETLLQIQTMPLPPEAEQNDRLLENVNKRNHRKYHGRDAARKK